MGRAETASTAMSLGAIAMGIAGYRASAFQVGTGETGLTGRATGIFAAINRCTASSAYLIGAGFALDTIAGRFAWTRFLWTNARLVIAVATGCTRRALL